MGQLFLTVFFYELRSRYRFGRESIEFLVELLRDDVERPASFSGVATFFGFVVM